MSNEEKKAKEEVKDVHFKSEKSGKKFTMAFKGATGGNPYPTDFKEGDDCPKDLLKVAQDEGVVKK